MHMISPDCPVQSHYHERSPMSRPKEEKLRWEGYMYVEKVGFERGGKE